MAERILRELCITKTRELVVRKYYWTCSLYWYLPMVEKYQTYSCYQYLSSAGRTYWWMTWLDCHIYKLEKIYQWASQRNLCWKNTSYNPILADKNSILQTGADTDWCTPASWLLDSIVLRGSVVTSKFWSSLCCGLGVKQITIWSASLSTGLKRRLDFATDLFAGKKHELRFDLCHYWPTDAERIYQWVLWWNLHWKGTSYDLTLVIVGLHDEPM